MSYFLRLFLLFFSAVGPRALAGASDDEAAKKFEVTCSDVTVRGVFLHGDSALRGRLWERGIARPRCEFELKLNEKCFDVRFCFSIFRLARRVGSDVLEAEDEPCCHIFYNGARELGECYVGHPSIVIAPGGYLDVATHTLPLCTPLFTSRREIVSQLLNLFWEGIARIESEERVAQWLACAEEKERRAALAAE